MTIPTTLLKTQTKSRLAIPRGFSFILTPESDFSNYHNDKLPENVKVEYYQQLAEIVRSIPKLSVLENNLNECSLKLKEYFEDNKKITNDLANFPELEINYPYQRISTGINQVTINIRRLFLSLMVSNRFLHHRRSLLKKKFIRLQFLI